MVYKHFVRSGSHILYGLFLFLLSGFTVTAQQTPAPDLMLYVNPESLTIAIVAEADVSLAGFAFRVFVDGTERTFEPIRYFYVLEFQTNILAPGTCLTYRVNDTTPIPPQPCDNRNTFEFDMDRRDAFWLSDEGRTDLFILKHGSGIGQNCAAKSDECPIYYNIEPPIFTQELSVPDVSNIDLGADNITGLSPDSSLSSNQGAITALLWSLDDTLLVSGHENGAICLWNAQDELSISPLECVTSEHATGIAALTWNPQLPGLIFASGGQNQVFQWTINRARLDDIELQSELLFDYPATIRDLDWHPTKAQLAVAGSDDRVIVQPIGNPNPIYNKAFNDPQRLEWQMNGRFLALIDQNGLTRVIDTTSQELSVGISEIPVAGVQVAWRGARNQLATLGAAGTIRLIDFVPGEEVCPCPEAFITQNLPAARAIRFSPDYSRIAIAAERMVYVLQADPPYHLISQHIVSQETDARFNNLIWESTGRRLAAATHQGNIYIWRVPDTAPQRLEQIKQWSAIENKANVALAVAWDANAEGVAIVDDALQLSIWNINGSQRGQSVAHSRQPLAVAWNPTQSVIATGGCGPLINIWKLTGVPQRVFRNDSDDFVCVSALDFDPNGQYLVTANAVSLLQIWDWAGDTELTNKRKNLNEGVTDIAWSDSGERLAAVDNTGLFVIYDMINLRLVEVFVRQPEPGTPTHTIAWSNDSQQIATGSANRRIEVWNLKNASVTADTAYQNGFTLWGHTDEVIAASWHPRQDWLVSSAQNGQIIVWDVATGQRLAQWLHPVEVTDIEWAPRDASFAVTDIDGNVTLYRFDFNP